MSLEEARLEAQRRISTARERAIATRAGAAEEIALRNAAIDAETGALDERDRMLRDRNHHFSQHRHSYKERRAEADGQLEENTRRWQEVNDVLAQRAGLDHESAVAAVTSKVDSDLEAEHTDRVNSAADAVAEDAHAIGRNVITTAIERQDGGHTDTAPRITPTALEDLSPELREQITTVLSEVAQETSMEFAVDEEREQATLRGQNPLEREVARQVALEVLERKLQTADVHPSVLRHRETLARQVRTLGEKALWTMEMTGRPELAELVGTLHYRFSYGQNALLHCQEAGYLCGVLAAELGMDQSIARNAGMLHDVGKAADHDVEGSHAIIGGELLRIMGTDPAIVHAVKAHHFEEEPSTDLAMLTICADAISASRPGARRDTIAAYLARLEQLQNIATRHAGVDRAFPLQAGREVRIFVKAKEVPDNDVTGLGQEIAREIESEMQYPGMIKVTVIRETHASATAPAQLVAAGAGDEDAPPKKKRSRKSRETAKPAEETS